MNRHIVIEGPDGAGKTTLAKQLSIHYGYDYHHEGPPPRPDTSDTILHHYARLLLHTEQPTVFDRFHLGELVYGPLLRGGSGLDDDGIRLMHRLVTGLGVKVVLCLPSWETCLGNNRLKEEMIKDERVLEEAYELWIRVLLAHHVNMIRYDYTQPEESARESERKFQPCPVGAIGSPAARFLFIGEQPNGPLDLPFFSGRNSSQFLNAAIKHAGFAEEDIAFTNALDADGRPRDLYNVAHGLPQLEVVVPLGTVAAERWHGYQSPGKLPVQTRPVAHPAYWKRFHYHEPGLYVNELKEIHAHVA